MGQNLITGGKNIVIGKEFAEIFKITLFAGLTALGAQIEIPAYPVPFTLQTFFVLLSGAFLGARNGAVSQLLYLLAGTAGLPVFSGFGFGIVRLFGPAGGYLLSFPVAALVVGYLSEKRRNFAWSFLSMLTGLFTVFAFGTFYLNTIYLHDWSISFKSGVLIFSWWDCLKLIAAAGIFSQLSKKKSRISS